MEPSPAHAERSCPTMKIPQNLPRFSDYTREEALRLLLE